MRTSKTRLKLRIGLGIAFVMCLSFFLTSAYFYVGMKRKTLDYNTVAPNLFKIDVYQHQALAIMSSNDAKLKIGKSLYQKRIFSEIYKNAGTNMIEELAENGHAESQTTYGDILMNQKSDTINSKSVASYYYGKAAEQGYEPAQERLALIEKIDRIK